MSIDHSLYSWLAGWSTFMVFWVMLFTLLSGTRIVAKLMRGGGSITPNPVLAELPAVPLIVLQTVMFAKAVHVGDWFTAAAFAWWGPGFWLTLIYLAACRLRGTKPNWAPTKHVIAWACKLNYVLLIALFIGLGYPALAFVYSVWIINDQIGMAFLSHDVDRLRRTFHDRWLVRICYPAGLFVPLVVSIGPYTSIFAAYGVLLFTAWLFGVRFVQRRIDWQQVPQDQSLLRNMVYFASHNDIRHHPPRGIRRFLRLR
jgi:hypothetical protein